MEKEREREFESNFKFGFFEYLRYICDLTPGTIIKGYKKETNKHWLFFFALNTIFEIFKSELTVWTLQAIFVRKLQSKKIGNKNKFLTEYNRIDWMILWCYKYK